GLATQSPAPTGGNQMEPVLRAGEGRRGEYQPEATLSVRNVRDHPITHRVSAGDERLLAQTDARIVEDPHVEMLVRRNDVDGVHPQGLPSLSWGSHVSDASG